MTDTPNTVLTTEQRARAEALRLARDTITGKNVFGAPAVPDALDLIEVATWIIGGQDPLADYRQADKPLPDVDRITIHPDDDTQLGSVTA